MVSNKVVVVVVVVIAVDHVNLRMDPVKAK